MDAAAFESLSATARARVIPPELLLERLVSVNDADAALDVCFPRESTSTLTHRYATLALIRLRHAKLRRAVLPLARISEIVWSIARSAARLAIRSWSKIWVAVPAFRPTMKPIQKSGDKTFVANDLMAGTRLDYPMELCWNSYGFASVVPKLLANQGILTTQVVVLSLWRMEPVCSLSPFAVILGVDVVSKLRPTFLVDEWLLVLELFERTVFLNRKHL